MSVAKKTIRIENFGNLRKLTISNPKRKNALSIEAYTELTGALNDAAVDDTVTIVAITGDGDYYSSGNDISNFLNVSDPQKEVATARATFKAMVKSFYTFPKLLICVVNGPCIGIAGTTAALCDIIYATDTAYFHTPFSSLGLCAEGGASYTFPRILGKSKASEMLMINHKLSADEAYRFNFVSKVYTKSELETILWPQIQEYSKLPVKSLEITKKLMKKFEIKDLEKVCDEETEELYKRFESDDFIIALTKFLQRKSKL